jgi:hypothetical protein
MKTMPLIDAYRKTHRGKSAFIDSRMAKTEQSLLDAERSKDPDFVLVNLYLARSIMAGLLEAIPAPDTVRLVITEIRDAIDNDIAKEFNKRKA